MSSVISVTLDTSCIIDLGKDQPPQFRRAMEKLLELAREARVDLAVTTRVESEAKYPSTIEAYRNLIRRGRNSVIASTTRLGYWRLGVDVLLDEEIFKSIAKAVFPNRNPETLFSPGGTSVKGFLDVDHLYSHRH